MKEAIALAYVIACVSAATYAIGWLVLHFWPFAVMLGGLVLAGILIGVIGLFIRAVDFLLGCEP